MTETERCDLLERVLRSYCPNDGYSYKAVDEMARDRKTKAKDYIYAIVDGLKWGNWPWVHYKRCKHPVIVEGICAFCKERNLPKPPTSIPSHQEFIKRWTK